MLVSLFITVLLRLADVITSQASEGMYVDDELFYRPRGLGRLVDKIYGADAFDDYELRVWRFSRVFTRLGHSLRWRQLTAWQFEPSGIDWPRTFALRRHAGMRRELAYTYDHIPF
jgi:hypothetical protein